MQKKLLLILLTISLIPILIISVIAVKFLSSELEQAAINQSREYSTEVLLQIDGYLDKSFIALKTIASNPDIKAFDLVKAREQLLQIQKVYPENSFSLDDAKGNHGRPGKRPADARPQFGRRPGLYLLRWPNDPGHANH